jgi:hypothetical protein
VQSLLDAETRVAVRAGKLGNDVLRGLAPWASGIRLEGDRLTFGIASTAVLPEVVRYLVERGADVYEVTPQRLSLEDRFMQIVGEDGGL